MPEKSVSRILIIGFDLKRSEHSPDCPYDRLTFFIFNQAVLYCNHLMRSLPISPGDDIPLPVTVEDRMNFIPIVTGILHSNDRAHLSKSSEQLLFLFLLSFQLFFIRNTLKLASPAFPGNFTLLHCICHLFLLLHFSYSSARITQRIFVDFARLLRIHSSFEGRITSSAISE